MIRIIILTQTQGSVHTAAFIRDIIRTHSGIHGTATGAGDSVIPGTITDITGTAHDMHTGIIHGTAVIITAVVMAATLIVVKKTTTMFREQENTVPTGWPASESPADQELLLREETVLPGRNQRKPPVKHGH